MRHLAIGEQVIPLREPVGNYEEVIRAEEAYAWTLRSLGGAVVAWHRDSCLQYWTDALGEAPRHHIGRTREISTVWERACVRLTGKLVLDIGCGIQSDIIRRALRVYAPAGYVGIDHVLDISTQQTIPGFGRVTMMNTMSEPFPYMYIEADGLKVLSQLPDNTFGVLLNGIDDFMVDTRCAYGRAFADEVARITDPESAVLGVTMNGGVLECLARRDDFRAEKIGLCASDSTPGMGYYFLQKQNVSV